MKHLLLTTFTSSLLALAAAPVATAQAMYINSAQVDDEETALSVAEAAVPFIERPDSVRSLE